LKHWSALAVAWCEKANVSVSTLKRFRERRAIQKEAFISICRAVGIEDWELIAASPKREASALKRRSQQAKKLIAQEVLSNLNHLEARLDFVEQFFCEHPVEAQRQMIRQQITPALIQDINVGYGQLSQQQALTDVRSNRPDCLNHPLRIEANVSIIQITVSA
ncbi:MAG: hypothetical protein AAFP03_15960, partial [Cyanobacteria bacterium J06598_3]